jgi:hypothetical protein
MLDSSRINAIKQGLTSRAHNLCSLVGFNNCSRDKLCGRHKFCSRDKLFYMLKIYQDRR